MAGQHTQLESECRKTVEHYRKELGKVRSGRASGSILEGITVEYYGSQVPLMQLGLINTPEPRQITVQAYDPSACDAIEKAIHAANLGLNPARDGNLIRINIPPLTEERRKEFIKKLHKTAEDTRVSVRNHRRDAIEILKKREKGKEISSDDLRRAQEEVQKITDRFIAEIDQLLAAKEKEMMEV